MELSIGFRRSSFHFSSLSYSHNHNHPCTKGRSVPAGACSGVLASSHGFRFGCIALKRKTQRYLETYGRPHVTICGLKEDHYPSQSSLNHEENLHRTYKGWGSYRRRKVLRDLVVRSELADTGTAGASYPSSELWFNSKFRGICFYIVTSIAAITLFVPMVLQHPLVLMFDRYRRKAQYRIAKAWAFLTVAPFFKIEYEGLENLPQTDTPAMYVSNHQSFLDIHTLLTLGISFKFISKTSIFLYPIIGWAMFLMGVIPLKRTDSRSQLECLKQCMSLIKKGASVFFFPEGTRSRDGKLGTFKKGAFTIAAKTGVPVVPITLIGTGKIMPPGMEQEVNPGLVKVIIHPYIVGNNPDELCKEARNIIAQELIRQG
ncbi:1-acyl-sn-glycerol-3-phosphate acyltransferase BAT2, chloroplastic-like isoform X2 [Salvia splendens]|uniref:1-acyl-sn-glycerol-3-phosphate acyltransferase BAT2, chloroplastic-like isoform X2 n=1 Tax=Salvia splendens TaxID=180675 RepID=UPI001C260F28|nr:1-acyl-sn-glycerol-3-phosphate acyltransferase BAT2, chloroplastic-like isoform X2 [Salvia splendens]